MSAPAFDCLTRQDVLDYHASRYVPNNVVLSIAGDVDAAEILSHLELLVEDLKSRPLNREPIPHEPHQFGSRRVRKEFAVPYSKLHLAWRLPCSAHPDTPALSALSSILGGGRSARFYEKFHDRLGLVYSIEVHSNQSETDEGAFTISMDVDRAQRDQGAGSGASGASQSGGRGFYGGPEESLQTDPGQSPAPQEFRFRGGLGNGGGLVRLAQFEPVFRMAGSY